jgi:hypothetical protein
MKSSKNPTESGVITNKVSLPLRMLRGRGFGFLNCLASLSSSGEGIMRSPLKNESPQTKVDFRLFFVNMMSWMRAKTNYISYWV